MWVGDYSNMNRPLPIPNREVKHIYADARLRLRFAARCGQLRQLHAHQRPRAHRWSNLPMVQYHRTLQKNRECCVNI